MWLLISLLFISTCALGFKSIGRGLRCTHKSVQARKLEMGYVPPEKDPEYRPMVKKSLLKPLDGDESAAAMKIK